MSPAQPNLHESSSNPSDPEGLNPYPEMMVFMETLATLYLKRNLDRHVKFFEDKGFLHIDELKSLQVQDLTSEHFGFLEGTAMFLLAEVNKWVCTVDKTVRRAKKARRSEM